MYNNYRMKLRLLFVVSILVTCYCSPLCAQSGKITVSGTVFDSLTHLPLPLVSVVNQSGNDGTSTTDDGKFSLHCAPGDTLLFTMVGYAQRKRTVTSGAMIVFLTE